MPIKRVQTKTLGCAIYVVPDGMPIEQRPADLVSYTESEIKVMRKAGEACAPAVHMVKELLEMKVYATRTRKHRVGRVIEDSGHLVEPD